MCVIVIGKLITCFLLLWTELERMKNTFPFSTPELCCFGRPRSIREGRGLLAEECWMDSIRKGGDWKLGIFHYSFNRYVSLTYARHFSRHWIVVVLVAKLCPTLLWPYGLQPARLLYPWDSPGKNTGVSCHFLFQGIFPTQGSNSCLLHWLMGPLPLNHLESPGIGYIPESRIWLSGDLCSSKEHRKSTQSP